MFKIWSVSSFANIPQFIDEMGKLLFNKGKNWFKTL